MNMFSWLHTISKVNHLNDKLCQKTLTHMNYKTLSINLLSSMHLVTNKWPFSQCGEVHAAKGFLCTCAGTF